MRICIVLTCCLLAGVLGADAWSAIYKTVDEEGNVVFTDIPPKDQSKPIAVERQNTYQPPVHSNPAAPTPEAAESEEVMEVSAVSYASLTITSPSNEEAVRHNAGNITVTVAATPALDIEHGHNLQILMDGNPLASSGSNSVSLTNVDRGTHSLVAQILDADGQVLIASQPVTFQMLRYSALMRKPAGS